MPRWLHTLLQISPEELPAARALFAQHFVLIAALMLAKAARDGLFLSVLPATTLPLVFLGLAAWTALTVYLVSRFVRGRPTHQVLAGIQVASGLSLFAFAAWFALAPKTASVLFYLWYGTYGVLVVAQFWILAGERINPRQARRLFPAIVAAGIFGGLVGGGAAFVLANYFPSALFLVGAGLLHLALVPAAFSSGRLPHEAPPDREWNEGETPIGKALAHPYVRTVALLFLLAGVASTLLEYQFKYLAQQRIVGERELTSFFGLYHWAQGLVALVLQVLATRWVLFHLGARWGRLGLPGGILLGSIGSLLVAPFLPVILTRVFDGGCRNSLYRTAGEFLFFPLSDSLRRAAKRFIDVVVSRSAEAVAALLILAVGASMGGAMWQLSLVLALVAATWLGVDLWTQHAYRRELSSNLQSFLLKNADPSLSLREVSVLRELEGLLDSPDPLRVEYAFDLLLKLDADRVRERIPELVTHTSPKLRARALELAAQHQIRLEPQGLRELLSDDDLDVRMNASYVHCVTSDCGPEQSIQALLREESMTVRLGALQCISSHSQPELDAEVDRVIGLFVADPNPEARMAAARAIGRRTPPTLAEHHLFTLLFDPEPEVRKHALLSAGRLKSRESVPHLIERLEAGAESKIAIQALTLYGDRVVGTLADHVVDPSVPIRIRRELPTVLARIGTTQAIEALVRASVQPDRTLSYRSLKALNKLRERIGLPAIPRDQVFDQLRADAADYQRLARAWSLAHGLEEDGTRTLLLRVLRERSDQAMERLFRRLGLLYPSQDAYLAYLGVTYHNERLRTQAVEFLDTVLEQDHRRLILPLLESTDRVALPSRTWRDELEQSLRALTEGADPWLLLSLYYAAGVLRLESFRDLLERGVRAGDARLRETASRALTHFAAGGAAAGS